jgi:predicted acetyltransferase
MSASRPSTAKTRFAAVPELIDPEAERHAAWLDCHREWGLGLHEDGFGIGPDDEVETAAGFAAWVERLRSRPGRLWWIVEQDVVLGGIVLRPFTTDEVLRVGHIGYGVRPSARGHGIATWALGQVLGHARGEGLESVLLVCFADNAASIKTIERFGGVLAKTVDDGHGLARHYWVDLSSNGRRRDH